MIVGATSTRVVTQSRSFPPTASRPTPTRPQWRGPSTTRQSSRGSGCREATNPHCTGLTRSTPAPARSSTVAWDTSLQPRSGERRTGSPGPRREHLERECVSLVHWLMAVLTRLSQCSPAIGQRPNLEDLCQNPSNAALSSLPGRGSSCCIAALNSTHREIDSCILHPAGCRSVAVRFAMTFPRILPVPYRDSFGKGLDESAAPATTPIEIRLIGSCAV